MNTTTSITMSYKVWQEWMRDPGSEWITSGTTSAINYGKYVNMWPTWVSSGNSTSSITIPRRGETHVPVNRPPQIALNERVEPTLIKVQKDEAEKRSLQLLCFALNEEQRKELEEHERITVYSQLGNFYCLTIGWSHNVYLLDEQGRPIRSYCAHVPRSKVPVYDNVLAQILMLQNNERGFLSIANKREIDPNSKMGRTPMITTSTELMLPANSLVSGLKEVASRIRDLVPA